MAQAASPMIAQYLALKAEAPDALLFFRMGDFYELFFDDAAAAARALDIALTARGSHGGEPIPMCGVPVERHEAYLAKLVRGGHRVAIAEQVEDPVEARKRPGKALVRRAIVRVLTPGTATDEALVGRAAAWLAAVAVDGRDAGLAWADASTGELFVRPVAADALGDALDALAPAEWVHAEGVAIAEAPAGGRGAARSWFDAKAATRSLAERWGVATLDGFGAFGKAELGAMGAVAAALADAARGAPVRLRPPVRVLPDAVMAMDAATRASLNIVRGAGGAREGSLLACIDCTVTAGGARLLEADLGAPLTDVEAVRERLALAAWFADESVRRDVRGALRQAPDLARAAHRVASRRDSPRDLAAVRDALAAAGALRAMLEAAGPGPALLGATLAAIDPLPELLDVLRAALVAQPPGAGEAGAIAGGWDHALDGLRLLAHDGRRAIAQLEGTLRARTGVATLKVRHNNVIGHHVEVPQKHADPLMAEGSGFQHRQTLAGVLRFDTPELRDLGAKIAQAGAAALVAEAAHLEELRERVSAAADAIARTAAACARLDVAASHAEVAASRGWVKPDVVAEPRFRVAAGRHPMVAAAREKAGEAYVPNDAVVEGDARAWLLTGPNMGGKSTLLRQCALIAVLAQAGSFVPADAATLGIVDRLFSRVGASDELARGRSTFMVEMVETAAILRGATDRSLVILDEVGRGTSTFDGLALAWAILEALHDRVGCRTLFATHYHELTALREKLPRLACKTMRVRAWRGAPVFLHEAADGVAEGSFGLAVAKMAGVPADVLARAGEVLGELEARRPVAPLSALPLFGAAGGAACESPANPSDGVGDALREALAAMEPDAMSPREAMDALYRLKAL